MAVFGCEMAESYLEHQEFKFNCDNLALCWLLCNIKDMRHLEIFGSVTASFKFKVQHTKCVDNVMADSMSRMFKWAEVEVQDENYLALLKACCSCTST